MLDREAISHAVVDLTQRRRPDCQLGVRKDSLPQRTFIRVTVGGVHASLLMLRLSVRERRTTRRVVVQKGFSFLGLLLLSLVNSVVE